MVGNLVLNFSDPLSADTVLSDTFCLFLSCSYRYSNMNGKKAQMLCLGFEPGPAEWYAHTYPLSYGGRQLLSNQYLVPGFELTTLGT